MGYQMRPAFYRSTDYQLARSPQGELVGLRRAGASELYLERDKLWPTSQSILASSAGQATANDDDNGEGVGDDGEEDEDDDDEDDDNEDVVSMVAIGVDW
ncbi:hypothetical protein LTR95_000957 [Oleoguttula sp. CCFEE 5521]